MLALVLLLVAVVLADRRLIMDENYHVRPSTPPLLTPPPSPSPSFPPEAREADGGSDNGLRRAEPEEHPGGVRQEDADVPGDLPSVGRLCSFSPPLLLFPSSSLLLSSSPPPSSPPPTGYSGETTGSGSTRPWRRTRSPTPWTPRGIPSTCSSRTPGTSPSSGCQTCS